MLTLVDDTLGTLELRGAPYTVASFQIGSRSVRSVMRSRALADGSYDDTEFSGSRAVTIAVRLNESQCPPGTSVQALYDTLLPYMSPRRRPKLRWELPGAPGVVRELTVRGESAPVVVDRARHLGVVCSFVAPEGEITSIDTQTVTISPSTDTVAGRSYDLTHDRTYPASLGPGDRLVVNGGNERAHWTASVYGECENPRLTINGVTIEWEQVLNVGDWLQLDSRERTMYFNADTAESRYHVSNYTEWTWADVLLQPGQNIVRFSADTLGPGGSVVLNFRDTWC